MTMNNQPKLYAERAAHELDEAGNYYARHVAAMTSEGLHSKSAIAAELGHRDLEIDRLRQAQAAPVADDLDSRMRAAGMLTVADLLKGAPLDAFVKHAGVSDMGTFAQWLEMRRKECLEMQARFELDKRHNDELYEWVFAHAAVFSEVHVNFKAARGAPPPDAELVELLSDALKIIRGLAPGRFAIEQDLRAKLASLR
jgi:hypothetical protein